MKQPCFALLGSVFFIFLAFTNTVFAKTYQHTYYFGQPRVTMLTDGASVIELEQATIQTQTPGEPLIPSIQSNLLIGAGETIESIDISTSEMLELEGTYTIQHASHAYPLSSSGPLRLTTPSTDIYDSDDIYPANEFQLERIRLLHGHQIVSTLLFPVRYQPASGKVRYLSHITLTINTSASLQPPSTVSRSQSKDQESVRQIIDNPEAIAEYPTTPVSDAGPRQYLIITTSDLITAFETLASHRRSLEGGSFNTYIEDVSNIEANYSGIDLAEKIRNYIINCYMNYGTEYVLLGGDADLHGTPAIPYRGMWASVDGYTDESIPSDLYYGALDGTWNSDNDNLWGEPADGPGGSDVDWDSEVFVGRIPADSLTEANNQITKIIAFETAVSFPRNALMTGQLLQSSPDTWGGDRLDWVEQVMTDFTTTKLYDRNEEWDKYDVISAINNNRFLTVNVLVHGNTLQDMRMSTGDIYNLQNSSPFFVYSQSCYAGSFDGRYPDGSYTTNDSFAETITNSYSTRGAFAFLGNSRYGWYQPGSYITGASNLFHKNFYSYAINNSPRLAIANQRSIAAASHSTQLNRWISFSLNLIGDPATPLFPTTGSSHPPSIDEFSVISATGQSDQLIARTHVSDADGNLSVIRLYINNEEYDQLTLDDETYNYSWAKTIYTDTFTPGEYCAKTIAEDSSGSQSDWSDEYCFEIPDIVPGIAPVIESVSITPEVDSATISITVTDPDSEIAEVTCEFDLSGSWISTTVTGSEYTCSTPQGLGGGDHSVVIRALDSTDLETISDSYSFNYPSSPKITSSQLQVDNTSVTISGTASDPDDDIDRVEIRLDSNSWQTAQGTESFSLTLSDLSAGDHTVAIRVIDSQDNLQKDPANTSLEFEIEAPFVCQSYSATNNQHVAANRATTSQSGWFWAINTNYYTVGSQESLGTNNGTTVTQVYEYPEGYFNAGTCPTPDVTPPVITLIGDNPMQVYQSSDFIDPGARASDDRDGDISSQVSVTGSVNTAVIGTYTLTYNVADTAGNQAVSVTRTVQVVNAPACIEFTSSVSGHESAGRAYSKTEITGQTCWGSFCWGGTTTTTWYVKGSDENLGNNSNTTVTLKEQPPGSNYFVQGECPSEPLPPVINSLTASVVADDVTITGTASDANDDIAMIMVYFDGFGFECSGTTSFTCVLEDVAAGSYQASVQATDSEMLTSDHSHIEFTVEEPQPPVVTLGSVNVIGNTLRVTGTVTDINNDIYNIGIALPGPIGNDCTITGTNYLCEIGISGFNPGTYPGGVTSFDSRSESGSVTFEFTVEEIVSHPPTIDNYEWSNSGSSFTLTGSASDIDGDLSRIVLSGQGLGSPVTCSGTSSFTCQLNNLAAGNYSLQAVAYDAENNSSNIIGPFTFTVEEQQVTCFTDTNINHTSQGRAVQRYGIIYYAAGSNAYIGLANSITSLDETSPGYWTVVNSCP